MQTKIQKWGNSNGIRLPKIILDTLNLNNNDELEIVIKENNIVLSKSETRKHITLAERLENNKTKYKFEEWETGKAIGNEVL